MTQKTLVFLTDNTSLPPLTHFNMGNRAASLQDLNIALSAEPNNPAYRQLERQLSVAAPKARP